MGCGGSKSEPSFSNRGTSDDALTGGDITISETFAHAVAADSALDGELTLVQLHDIAATKYADEETPVWKVHSAKAHGGQPARRGGRRQDCANSPGWGI